MIRTIIVEDDYRIAGIHEKFINKLVDITVVGKALTGKEAIQLADSKDADLVILDLYLPDMPGVEVIKELRLRNSKIDFIVISAAVESDIVSSILRHGVFDYIIKPVEMDRFVSSIERYKKTKGTLESNTVIEQSFLDNYFGSQVESSANQTPKGIDRLTLEKVKEIIENLDEGITAEEMGVQIGASRTTARRYLEYLISIGHISAELEYGAVGRPERRYYLK